MSYISTVGAVREEIAARLNEVESDNTDQYTNWVNQGIQDFKLAYPTNPYYFTSADTTLSSGTRIYAAPTGFDKMYSITYPAKTIKLKYTTPEQFDLLSPSASTAGDPMIYTIRYYSGSPKIEYYFSPDGSITLHQNYFRTPTTVSAGSASLDVPAKFYEGLVLYGTKQGLRRRGKWTEAREVADEYERLKELIKMDLMEMANENYEIKSIRDFQKSNATTDPITNEFSS